MKIPHHIHKCFIIQTETGKLFDMVDVRDLPDQLIITSPDPVHHPVFFACFLDADDNFGTFFPLSYKLYDHVHRILEVRTHTDHTVTRRLFQSVDR